MHDRPVAVAGDVVPLGGARVGEQPADLVLRPGLGLGRARKQQRVDLAERQGVGEVGALGQHLDVETAVIVGGQRVEVMDPPFDRLQRHAVIGGEVALGQHRQGGLEGLHADGAPGEVGRRLDPGIGVDEDLALAEQAAREDRNGDIGQPLPLGRHVGAERGFRGVEILGRQHPLVAPAAVAQARLLADLQHRQVETRRQGHGAVEEREMAVVAVKRKGGHGEASGGNDGSCKILDAILALGRARVRRGGWAAARNPLDC